MIVYCSKKTGVRWKGFSFAPSGGAGRNGVTSTDSCSHNTDGIRQDERCSLASRKGYRTGLLKWCEGGRDRSSKHVLGVTQGTKARPTISPVHSVTHHLTLQMERRDSAQHELSTVFVAFLRALNPRVTPLKHPRLVEIDSMHRRRDQLVLEDPDRSPPHPPATKGLFRQCIPPPPLTTVP